MPCRRMANSSVEQSYFLLGIKNIGQAVLGSTCAAKENVVLNNRLPASSQANITPQDRNMAIADKHIFHSVQRWDAVWDRKELHFDKNFKLCDRRLNVDKINWFARLSDTLTERCLMFSIDGGSQKSLLATFCLWLTPDLRMIQSSVPQTKWMGEPGYSNEQCIASIQHH